MMTNNRYFGLALFFIFNLITWIDRLSTGAVLAQLQDHFHLSVAQVGLLGAFHPVGQVLSTPLFGYLGDRVSRKWIIFYCVLLWNCSMLAASLLAGHQYYLLYVARLMAGIGSSGCSIVAPLILADLFHQNQRKTAVSVYFTSGPLGVGLGYVLGIGALALGDWRWAFRMGPLVALASLLALLLFEEPARGKADGSTGHQKDTDSVLKSFCLLMRTRSFVWSTLAFTCFQFHTTSSDLWLLNFMTQSHPGMEEQVPMILGPIVCLGGLIGVNLGGLLARYLARFSERPDPIVGSVSLLAGALLTYLCLATIKTAPTLSWIVFGVDIIAMTAMIGPLMLILMAVTEPTKRALANSIQQFVSSMLGSSTGPYLVGVARLQLEHYFDQYTAFFYAMAIPPIGLALGGIAFLLSARSFVKDRQQADEAAKQRALMSSLSSDHHSSPDAAYQQLKLVTSSK